MNRFFFRTERNGYVVYDRLSSEIFFVNYTGKFVFDLINKGCSEKEIIKKLSKNYSINKGKIKKDIKPILDAVK